MNNFAKKNFKVFLRLYWLKILVIFLIAFLIFSFIAIMATGVKAFVSMESFYRKAIMSQMAFYLYIGIIQAFIFAAIYMGFHYYFFFGEGMTKLGRRRIEPEKVNIKWTDVVGMEEIKKEIWEVIQLIKNHAQIKEVGGKIIRGVLLVGPPGCGKTYLAKAIAAETGLPFLHATGSDFRGIFVGVGTARIKGIFKEARALAQLYGGCIIFIDEIDTIARPRVTPTGWGAGMDYNATINQLLAEMDGVANSQDYIVVFGATNVSEDELDEALMRPGRFDRKIYVGLPGLKDREKIIQYYLNKIKYDHTVDIKKLARLTVGCSPADIANIIRESSLIAARKGKTSVGMSELDEARERISLGIKAEVVLSEKDRLISAYHEAGHTMVAYLLVPTHDVFKASIIPRRGVRGATWIMETEERFIHDKEELLGRIKIALGGYAAEKFKFGVTSEGVEKDLALANKLALNMVTQWGMGTSGPASYTENPYFYNPLLIQDKEDIINNCLEEVNEMLRQEKDILEEIAQKLLEKEELDFDALDAIFRKYGKGVEHNAKREYLPKEKQEKSGLGWEDVVGMDEVKEEAKEIVKLIKDRVTLQQVGGQIIRGLLLFGPPGCGKTYLASVIAKEAGVPFIAKSGSEFVEIYVGVGASRIRHLFQEARERALQKGGCIIFIDEIDALGGRRAPKIGGGQTEYNQTLNQLLVEMDGLKEKGNQYNIVVIGATNVEESFLDPALLRPGRFDRKIYVDLPTYEDRVKLFEYYLKKVNYNPEEVKPEEFAGITRGWSPADIANLVREAALLAVRNNKDKIGIKEMEEARERIELGLKRRLKLSKQELLATAYHEIGHIIAEYFFGKKMLPFKVSIIPRTKSLGVAWFAEKKDVGSWDRKDLLTLIKIYLAGYAAEKSIGESSSGVTADFKNAMKIAHDMVWKLGMGKSGLIGDFEAVQNTLSESMKAKLDEETQEILQDCLKETENLLAQKKELLEFLVHKLMEKEELQRKELEEIFSRFQSEKS